jgi:hypothetical protein
MSHETLYGTWENVSRAKIEARRTDKPGVIANAWRAMLLSL